jgi:hypothetical protein
MNRSADRSQDPSPFAWLMAGAVAAGLGSLLAARRRKRQERDLWAQAESGPPGSVARRPDTRRATHGPDDAPRSTSGPEDTVAGHPT